MDTVPKTWYCSASSGKNIAATEDIVEITTASEQGTKRCQEDRVIVKRGKNGVLLAVADGHGGKSVAEFVVRNLPDIFFKQRERKTLREALRATFAQLAASTRNEYPGATLSVAWISERPRRAYIGVLGDSPVIVQQPNKEPWVSPEHNARTNLAEREAAIRRGGLYCDGYIHCHYGLDGLQLTRTLGDEPLDKILNREPELFSFPLTKGSIVILATDGVLDPRHEDSSGLINHLLQTIRNNGHPGGAAQEIVNDAILRETKDNASAIVCKC